MDVAEVPLISGDGLRAVHQACRGYAETGPGEGSEQRFEEKTLALQAVLTLVPADDSGVEAMEGLLGKFVEARVERVPEPGIYMRPAFRPWK